MEILQLIDVTKTYEVDTKERHVLNHFSYGFPTNGLIGIVGKSGSGKSTLLNMISLLDKPTSGDIYFNSENINKWSNKRKIEYHNKDLGFVFQHYNLIESETVMFNIILPGLIAGYSEEEVKKRAVTLLESIKFRKELYYQKACNLSGGEKERVAILRALINNPRIILADEPTGALDSDNSRIIMNILKEISITKLVIVVSHNDSLIEQYAQKIIILKDGKMVDVKNLNSLKVSI